jgi:phospholipase/carboxylesterase
LAEQALEDLAAVVPPLLQALEALGFIGRHLNPPDLPQVMKAVGEPDQMLRDAVPRLEAWPDPLAGLRSPLQEAAQTALAAFEGLRGAAPGDVRSLYRALRHLPRAQEALYPLAVALPPVSRFFLSPAARQDAALQRRLAEAPVREDVGVSHVDNEPGSRGGFSLYVPEYYEGDRDWPLVVALHGGAGNGRSFLWSWLRDARSEGAILIAPTAVGDTWALGGPDRDTPNLMRILDQVRARWRIDPARLLMTGMSDGGTFSYVSGLEPASPFTHLAPIAASFHPLIAEMADPDRIGGLPIFLIHGALDWMFPVAVARAASQALTAAGASVRYLELEDLSHTYPQDVNPTILDWVSETA